MNKHHLTLAIQNPFANLHRPRCVLIAAFNDQAQILVGTKPYLYPPTITRLLGGGVDGSETLRQAGARELSEELSIVVAPDDLIPLAHFVVAATDATGHTYHHDTRVYAANIGSRPYQAGDDVEQIIPLTVAELHDLADRYDNLPANLWHNGTEGEYSWADYAKMYSPIHRIVADQIKQLM